MNSGKLIGLAVVAVVALIAALWLSGERAPVRETEIGSPLIASLEAGLNDITQVSIRNAEGGTTLVRNDESWGIDERAGYPADVSKLREQLIKLAGAKLLEAKTSNPDNYSRLSVEDPMTPDATGVLLTIDGVGDPIHLVVGDYTARAGDGTYVRFHDQEQSWLVSANLNLDTDVGSWLVKDVLNISSDRIASVALRYPDEGALDIAKQNPDDTNFAVENLPEGRELTSDSAPNSIANALSSLRLDDVRRLEDVDLEAMAVTQSVFDTFDGLRVTARSFEEADKKHVTFEVAFADELIPQDETDSEAAEGSEAAADAEGSDADSAAADAPAESRAEKVARAQAEAQELQAKVAGWVYEIPSYKYTSLAKPIEDLLKPVETEEEAAE